MESYEEVLKRIRGYKGESQTPQSGVVSNKYEDVLSRIRGYENEVVQPAVPNTTVPTTVSPTQSQPEKRSFGEGAKEFGKAVGGSLGAGILNILRTTLATLEQTFRNSQSEWDLQNKQLRENLQKELEDARSGKKFSVKESINESLEDLQEMKDLNKSNGYFTPLQAVKNEDLASHKLIKPTEEKVREWADVEDENLAVRIIAGAAGSAPQMLVSALNPFIGVPLLFNSNFMNNIEQYRAEGLDINDKTVVGRAVGSALIESASEYMFNAWAGVKGASAGLKGAKGVKGAFVSGTKGFLDNFAREATEKAFAPTVWNFIKFLRKQGLEEGLEELVSGIGSGLIALMTTDRGGKFMSWDKEGKKNLKGETIGDEGAIVVMDLIEQFGAGFLMGAVGSTVNTTRSFKSTRDVIQNVLGDIDMNSVTNEDVQTVLEILKQDLKSPEAQQELAEKLARGVSKAESVYAEGMQVKNNQTGEVMTLSIAPEGDEITLTSTSGVQKVTHEEFDAMFEQNILTEASPAQTAVNGSDLLPGTPVSGGAVTQQESMTAGGKSRKESVTSYADKKGRPTSIKSYMAGKEAVLEIANPGNQVPTYIRFDPDEYSQAENKAMYLQEVSSRSKTPMSKIASKNAQTVSEFYSAITNAADDAVSTYISEAQNASLKAEEEKKAVESKKTKEEQEKAQAVASVAFAKDEQTVQKETKGKRSDDFSQETIEKIDKLRKIARDVQKKDVKSGKMDKDVYDALLEIDKSMKRQDIDGYLNVIPDSQVTKRMKKVRDYMKEIRGKKIIFVNSVGDSRVNGVVNDFAQDTVFVNVTGRSDISIIWAIGHELHHLITKEGNGDIMTDAVKDLVGEKAIKDYLAQFEDMPGYQDFLRESGKVTEELVADRAGDVFSDPVFWRRIADKMPKSKWKKTANEIAEYLEKAQENAETEKPGVDAMIKALNATKKTDTSESNTASKIEMADEMLNMWKEEGEIPADLQDESERMSLEVATAASEILDVLDNSTTDFSFRSGIRGAMKGEDQRGSVESGIRTIFAPLLGTKKKWSNVDFVGKTVTSGRELAGVAMVARDPRIEHNHLYYVKNGKLIQHESWTSALPSSASALPFNVRHLKNKTEEQIRDVMLHQEEAETSRIKSRAAKLGADSIYMSHNHPSGNPEPSSADVNTCGSLMSDFGDIFKGMVVTDHNEYTFLSRNPSDPTKSLKGERGKLSKGEQGFSARDKASTKKLIDIKGSFSPEGIVRNLFTGISNFTIKDGDITLVFVDAASRITAVQNVPAGMGKKANAEQFAGYIKNSQTYFGGAMVFAVTFNRPGSTSATFAELTSGVFDYGVLEDVLLYDIGASALKSQRKYSNTKPDRSTDRLRDLSSTILRDSEKTPNRYHTDFSLKVDTSKINDEAYSKLIVTKAKKVFGTTFNKNEAGFIMEDGTMLDFSGKRDGGQPGARHMDHREVAELYDGVDGTEALQQFFADTGAVRISYSKDMVFADITRSKPLTDKQVSALKSILPRHDSVVVDFYDNFASESPTKSFEYDMPLVSDISKMLDEIQGMKEKLEFGKKIPDNVENVFGEPPNPTSSFSISPTKLEMAELSEQSKKLATHLFALEKIQQEVSSLLKQKYESTRKLEFDKKGRPVLRKTGKNKGKQKFSGQPGLAIMNVHNINLILSENEDIRERLIAIKKANEINGVEPNFVTDDGYLIAYAIETQEMDEKRKNEIEPGTEKRKEQEQIKMWAFSRGIPQTYIENMDSDAFEELRKSLVALTEKVYRQDPETRSGGFLDIIPSKGKPLSDIGKEGLSGIQTPIKLADKTIGAISLNSLCPMFTVGNHGCYLDGCYLTSMANGASGTNLFWQAMYTGEILQLSDDSIAALNEAGGIRINGVGDATGREKLQWADIIRHANMRGLDIKVITKQERTFVMLDEIRTGVSEGYKNGHHIKQPPIDISKVIVQPSLDNIWTPVVMDEYYQKNVRGAVISTNDIIGSVKLGNLQAAADAYMELYGREAKIINGQLYRKDGFSEQQVLNIQKKYPNINVTPRYVVTSPVEIAELALRGKDIILTLMHGAVNSALVNSYGGELLNFNSYRHIVGKDKNGWYLMGVFHTDKGISEPKQTRAYKVVEDYIKNNYTPEEQDIIFTNLEKSLCCQENSSVDACAQCATHGVACSKKTISMEHGLNDIQGALLARQQYEESLKTSFSIRTADSEGRTLTEEQAKFFQDSKVRDENGRLLTLYTGTSTGGFTTFLNDRKIWLTSVYNSAKAYAGAKEGNIFAPSKDTDLSTKEYKVGKKYTVKTNDERIDFIFDSKDDFEQFEKDIGGKFEDYITEEEYDELEYEYDDGSKGSAQKLHNLERKRKLSKKIRSEYKKYNRDKSRLYTISELLKSPDLFSRQDFVNAMYAMDSNASVDEDGISDKESLIEYLMDEYEQANDGESIDEFYDISVFARVPENSSANTKTINDTNTVYKSYANVVNPYVFDNKGNRHNDAHSGYYQAVDYAEKNKDKYDGVIIKNVEVGPGGSGVGTTVVVFNPNQAKSVENLSPTQDPDIRYSMRMQDIERQFKDSKVRNEDGSLKMVYHGTNRGDFNIFTLGEKKFNLEEAQVGFFFTDNIRTAKEYAAAYEPNRRINIPVVKNVYLNLKNPLVIDSKGGGYYVPYQGRPVKTDKLAVIAKKDGYDGVIINNIKDSPYSARIGTTYIAFEPTQIKSPDGTNPVDLQNPDIRYSIKQEFSSKDTSLNQVPALHKRINWIRGTVNLDYGGGKFDTATKYLKENGITSFVHDAYNRTPEHNKLVEARLKKSPADTATIANVLNVIKEPEIREDVLRKTASMVKDGGVIYISVYEGNRSGEGKETTKGWQNNRKTEDYLEEVKRVFPDAFRNSDVIIATKGERISSTQFSMNSLDQFGGNVFNHPAFTSPLRTWLESKADLKMPPIHWIKQLTSAPFKSEHEVDFLGIKDWILEQKQSITGRDILAFYEMHNAMFTEMDDADDSEPNRDEEDDPDWEPKKIHKWKDYSPGKEFKDMPGNKAKFDNYRMKSVVMDPSAIPFEFTNSDMRFHSNHKNVLVHVRTEDIVGGLPAYPDGVTYGVEVQSDAHSKAQTGDGYLTEDGKKKIEKERQRLEAELDTFKHDLERANEIKQNYVNEMQKIAKFLLSDEDNYTIMENLEDIGYNELHLNDTSIEVLWDYIHQLQRHIRDRGFSDPEYSPYLDELIEWDMREYIRLMNQIMVGIKNAENMVSNPLYSSKKDSVDSYLRILKGSELVQHLIKEDTQNAFNEQVLAVEELVSIERRTKHIEWQLKVLEEGRTPDLPYKDDYTLLGFKMWLRDAVKNGHDAVMWSGWTHANRYRIPYNFAKVEVKNVNPESDNYSLIYTGSNPSYSNKYEFEQKVDFSKDFVMRAFGREIGEKILSAKEGDIISGQSSYDRHAGKVENSFIPRIYDEILPKQVNKYLRKYNAKAEYKEVEGLPGMHWVVDINPQTREMLLDAPQTAYSIRGKDPETGIDGLIEAHRFDRAFTEQYLSKDTLELLTDAHKFYRVQPNTETVQKAAEEISTKEKREAARIKVSDPDNISAVNTVLRMFFMYEADLRGEAQVAADWAYIINKSGKQSGKAVQAYAIFNKLTPGAKIMYAEREILGTVSEDNLKRIRNMGKEVKEKIEEIEGKANDQISIDDILNSVKQAETDVDRKLKALKRLEDRIKKMMSSTMDYDIDAIKEFIDMIHGVTSVMKPTEEIVNTSNPLAFMRWVLNNMDTMGEIMNQAYDMMKRAHGTDDVFMGEVEAYFSEFIPNFKGKKRPLLSGEITEEIKNIISENYNTFQAMVKRLIEIGVNPADAVLIARETRNQINLLTEQEKIRSLKKLLPKPNSKTTQMIIMKIINTMNDNELSDPHVQAYLAQTMGLPNMSPELQTYIYDLGRQISEINRLAAMDGRPLSKEEQRQTDILMAQILSAVQRAKPVHWTKKVDLFQSMMMMSMFKSAERNIIGNTGFLLVDTGNDFIASGIDKVLSKITGNRTIPLPQLGAMVHGAIEGGKVSYYDIMHDIDTSQLDTQYGLGGQEVFKSKLGRLAMKAFRLKMTFPDRIAQGAVYQSALEGIMKMKGETKASQETIEAAQYEAQYKTFSDDNVASAALSGLRDLLNNFYRSKYRKSGGQDKVQFGLGSFMIKFPKVPGALLMRTIDYSPVALVKSLYLLAKPMYDMRKFGGEFTEHFNQKKFAKSLASGTYGTAVSIGVGYLLTMLGLMTGALPDDDKERNMLATMGVSRGYQLNMSGLWRFLISGFDIEEAQMREGDTLTTYSWMAPMAIGMAIGANVVQDTIKIKETDAGAAEKALEVSIGAFSAGLDSITEMTVMSGLRDFIDNFKYSPTTLEALIKSTVDVPASFIPQQVKIMRELIDNTARTTYSNDNLEYAYRLILNRLPGASKTLPPSRTMFGNLREVYQGNGNNVWNVFFNPAYVTKYTPNEAAVMVLNVMAEKEGTALEGTNVTPGKMNRYLTYTDSLGMKKKINLTDYEISELQRKVGSRVEELFLKIPASTPMPSKIRMMNKILSEVSHAYKQQLLAQKLANRN